MDVAWACDMALPMLGDFAVLAAVEYKRTVNTKGLSPTE